MKKSMLNAMLCSLCALSVFSNTAIASPSTHTIDITCPGVATTAFPFIVTNFKDYIAGYGNELIDGSLPYPNIPYFTYTIPSGANIPSILTGYVNNGTDYDSTLGQVTCQFSRSGFDSFSVTYPITNGKGGVISTQTNNTIQVLVPFGIRTPY